MSERNPYGLTMPCPECPFLRGKKKGSGTPVRLTRGRVREIAGMMLRSEGGASGEFPCHKTLRRRSGTQHCAGALIFAFKNGTTTQMMRIAERLGMFNPSKLSGHERVFNSMKEMMATAIDR